MEIKMRIQGLPTKLIGEFENFQGNLKSLKERDMEKLKKSMLRNGFNAPIFCWAGHDYILDGHQRIKAIDELLHEGHTLQGGPKLPYVGIEADNEQQAAEMVLTYNSQYGHMSNKSLLEFVETFQINLPELPEFITLSDVFIEKFVFNAEGEGVSGSLKRDYIMPPFSVLDTRQADWQHRKGHWNNLMQDREKTREGVLKYSTVSSLKDQFQGGTSLFDPVLAEVLFKWFLPKGGTILNLFAGDMEPNIVAGAKNLNMIGIELREEQVEHTISQLKNLGFHSVKLICDDVLNQNKHIEKNSIDLLFSCPPYYDLEKYSDNPKDISNMEDQEFEKVIRQSIHDGVRNLKENRFAVFVVSEVRNKAGYFRKFIPKIIKDFEDAGAFYYNEIILINAIGTLPIRTRKFWEASRKVGRTHQNILVFYKGDTEKIRETFGDKK